MRLSMKKILRIIGEIFILISREMPLDAAISGTARRHNLPVGLVRQLWKRYGR